MTTNVSLKWRTLQSLSEGESSVLHFTRYARGKLRVCLTGPHLT